MSHNVGLFSHICFQLHLAKLARDSVERGRSDDLKALSKRSLAREDELNGVLADLEEQHSKKISSLYHQLKSK